MKKKQREMSNFPFSLNQIRFKNFVVIIYKYSLTKGKIYVILYM